MYTVFYHLTSELPSPRKTRLPRRAEETRKDRGGGGGDHNSFSMRVENLADYTGIRCVAPHLLPRDPHTPRTNSCPLRVIRAAKQVNHRCASRYTVYRGIPPRFLPRRIPHGREDDRARKMRDRAVRKYEREEAITCLRRGIIDDKALTPARRQRRPDT